MITLEIKIRNIDPAIIKVFDEHAKNRGVSRNEFLKSLLTTIAYNPLIKDVEREKNNVLSKVADGLKSTHERVENLEVMFEKLYLLTILNTGMSLEEVEHTIDNMIRREDE